MRFSLATKLTLFMGGAMALVVMAIAFTATIYVQKSLKKANQISCLSSAVSLARQIRAPLITKNIYSIHDNFQETVEQNLFYSAALLDSDGKVLMHSDLLEVGKIYDDAQSKQALRTEQPIFSENSLSADGVTADEVFVPIVVAGIRLGTLRLWHSQEEIEKAIGDARKGIVLVGIVATLASLLLANFLAGIISRPIRHLTEATKRVARGDLSPSVDLNKGDELGVLAHSFNAMTRELQRTTVSCDYLNNIFNSASDAIRTINLDYAIVMNNRSMTDFLNIEHEKLQGGKCYQFISADICNSDECVLRRVAKGEKIVQIETEIELYEGRKKHVRLTATPLMNNDRVVGVIESFQDISEQKVAEKESLNLQNQLLQAQKMESVGRLAGGVAHDFNNILSVIMGYTELTLLTVPKDNPLSEKLQIINDAAQKAAALVRQLLAFSRKQVLEMTVLNLNEIIGNMMKILSRVIGEDIKLEVSLPDSSRKIYGDQSQLVQVLMNLAVNARDAMPNGGKLVIETADVDLDDNYSQLFNYVLPGPYILLSVSDNGIGMSREVMKKIFEPFFTTKGPETGTGLGLSTVYGTIKQHGGHIHVYSEPDLGTTFKIYLPATDKDNTAVIPTDTWQARRGGETILIAEDEDAIRQLLKDILSPLGYQIFMAANGREALELYTTIAGKIDVLLTDVMMPEMDGKELAQRIAELSPETKIIFMSGYPQSIIMKHDSVLEHPYFLQKPITPSALSAKLREVLGEQAATTAS
jgi:two-component system cell cycle sensor histidine kinase/response regulator CckA